MRNTKLFLSLLLSLSIGLMPTVALADGETQVSEEEIIEETASSEMSEEADSEEEEEDTPGENSYDYGPNRDYTSETVKRVPLLYLMALRLMRLVLLNSDVKKNSIWIWITQRSVLRLTSNPLHGLYMMMGILTRS